MPAFNSRLTWRVALQVEKDDVHKKNKQLIEMYQDKKAKATQNEELYNRLKSRVMASRVQTAAQSAANQMSAMAGMNSLGHGNDVRSVGHGLIGQQFPIKPLRRHQERFPVDQNSMEQLHTRQRSGSGSNNGGVDDTMAMPPPRRAGAGFSNGEQGVLLPHVR